MNPSFWPWRKQRLTPDGKPVLSVQDGLHRLRKACRRAKIKIEFAAVPEDEIRAAFGDLPLTPELLEWYRHASPKDFEIPWMGGNDLSLFDVSELQEHQNGFRWFKPTPDAASERDPQWRTEWLLIGDEAADPVIYDTSVVPCPILYDLHGQGCWNPKRIAPDLGTFLALVAVWVEVYIIEFRENSNNETGFRATQFLERLSAEAGRILPADCLYAFIEFVKI